MTSRIVCIVEGDGEVRALPILLRRIAEAKGVYDVEVPPPIRVRKDQFLRRPEELQRKLLLAAAKAQGGTVLVLLDADEDCPVQLVRDVLEKGEESVPGATLHVVIANREYEAWLISAAGSLAGKRGLPEDMDSPANPDEIRNPKGWLKEKMRHGGYHEVSDQPALTAVFDLEQARSGSRSFRKLVRTVERAIGLGEAA